MGCYPTINNHLMWLRLSICHGVFFPCGLLVRRTVIPSASRAEAAHDVNHEANQHDQADPAAADVWTTKVKSAAAEQKAKYQ